MSTSELNTINDDDANDVGKTAKAFWFSFFFRSFVGFVVRALKKQTIVFSFIKIQFGFYFGRSFIVAMKWRVVEKFIFFFSFGKRSVAVVVLVIDENHKNSIRIDVKNCAKQLLFAFCTWKTTKNPKVPLHPPRWQRIPCKISVFAHLKLDDACEAQPYK